MKYTEEELEQIIDEMKEFLSSYKEADNEYQTNQRRENWKSKFGERFKPYEDKIKLLNGDNFDLMEESRNEYESQYSDLTDDEYCDALENNIKATLQKIWPDAEPEQIEQATNEVKEAVEEPTEEKAPEDTETTTTTEETVDDEGNKDVEVTEETKPEDEEDDEEEEEDPLDSFTKELEETKKSLPKRK